MQYRNSNKVYISFKNGQKLYLHRMDDLERHRIEEWLSGKEPSQNFYVFEHEERRYYINRGSIAHVEIDNYPTI